MKKLLFLPLLLLITLFLTPLSHAQTTPLITSSPTNVIPSPAQAAYPLHSNPDVPQNLHTYTQSVLIEILAGATCIVGGFDILSTDGRCLGIDPNTKKIGYVDPGQSIGLLGTMGNLISSTYMLPASSGTYIQHMASNFGITRTATAQETDPCAGVTPSDAYAECVANIPKNGEQGVGNGFDAGENDPCAGITLSEAYAECVANIPNMPGESKEGGIGKGIGFEGLKPVMQIWTVFRNLSYLGFVLLFVIIGLGIMFRLNIDARVVMTFQNQIPKIIIALIFITFSYAIAGFLIDMMYLSIYLIVNIFASNNLGTINDMSNPINAVGSFGGISNIADPAADGVSGMIGSIFEGSYGNNVAKLVVGVVGTMLGAQAGSGIVGFITQAGKAINPAAGAAITIGAMALSGVVGAAVGAAKGPSILQFVAGIVAYLIITIAIISALFRVWIMLIKSYVFILLDVIFAPFFIMGGLLPGSPGGGFSSWIRSLLGNLAAFPTVITLFLVGAAVQSNLDENPVGNFVPPLVGSAGDDSVRSIGAIIGLGIILIMPESVNIAKSMFKSPERKLAASAFQPIGAGTGALKKLVGSPLSKAWRKESDGTRGFLRAGFENKGTSIAKDRLHLGSIADKIPVVSGIKQGIIKNRSENIKRRAERLSGKVRGEEDTDATASQPRPNIQPTVQGPAPIPDPNPEPGDS